MALTNRARFLLDLLSTIAIVTTCGFLVWSTRPDAAPRKPGEALRGKEVSLAGAALKGSPKARIALLVYSDYQCPFCVRFEREILPAIEKAYIDTDAVLFALKHFPIPTLHPQATAAASAAVCATQREKGWEFHRLLFENYKDLSQESLLNIAGQVGLPQNDFLACLSGKGIEQVRLDTESATRLGISGTPVFLIGPILDGTRMRVAEVIQGARPFQDFSNAIETTRKAIDLRNEQ